MKQSVTNKLTVVWLCYFTNDELQKILKPLKPISEIAPWISHMIPLFENRNDIELHIISPHDWLPSYKTFQKNNISFHFINKGIPVIGRHWPGFLRFDLWTNFYGLKKKIAKIVNDINPDIIHLHGAENEFCIASTQFALRYPVFITIQGFISHSKNTNSKSARIRSQNEIEIISTFKHFGYRTETMGKDIRSINPDAVLHWHNYPMKKLVPMKVEKKFDVVFFARLSKDKGIDDLLKAASLVKKQKPDVSLCVIGGGKTDRLVELSTQLGIKENVFWAGFLPTQEDVHQMASSAKISVLPTYHDIIPGTIIESLFLKLPVVAYDVGSIHEVNKYDNIISLVEKGNVGQLSEEILTLLENAELRHQKSLLGYERVMEMFGESHDEIRQSIITAYRKTIESFHADFGVHKE